MRRSTAALVATLALCSGVIAAPASSQDAPPPVGDDPIFEALFPPELIMQHRRAINLTDEQRDAISRMIGDLQGEVVRLQWDLLDEMQQLTDIMARPRVDLDRALDQMNNVLETENEIKKSHLEMLVRIKNLLRPEQQATLERLRAASGGREG